MKPFAPILFAAAALAGGSAMAQADPALIARGNAAWAEQQLANQRSIALENQVNSLDARVATEARMRDLRTQSQRPDVTLPSSPQQASQGPTQLGAFPSIPDATLADSNAKVREASQDRR